MDATIQIVVAPRLGGSKRRGTVTAFYDRAATLEPPNPTGVLGFIYSSEVPNGKAQDMRDDLMPTYSKIVGTNGKPIRFYWLAGLTDQQWAELDNNRMVTIPWKELKKQLTRYRGMDRLSDKMTDALLSNRGAKHLPAEDFH